MAVHRRATECRFTVAQARQNWPESAEAREIEQAAGRGAWRADVSVIARRLHAIPEATGTSVTRGTLPIAGATWLAAAGVHASVLLGRSVLRGGAAIHSGGSDRGCAGRDDAGRRCAK